MKRNYNKSVIIIDFVQIILSEKDHQYLYFFKLLASRNAQATKIEDKLMRSLLICRSKANLAALIIRYVKELIVDKFPLWTG